MGTTYPAAVDDFTNHSAGDFHATTVTHAAAHNDLNDAVEAIETFLGAGSSRAVPTSAEVTFTETSGAGVYTGSVTVPAGAYLLDVLVHGVAVWDNAGTVAMDVGDVANANGMLIITSLKAGGDLVAGETLGMGTALDGGETGDDVSSSSWKRRYLSTERVISGVITTSSTGGSTGRTRMIVVWVPAAATPLAATKV